MMNNEPQPFTDTPDKLPAKSLTAGFLYFFAGVLATALIFPLAMSPERYASPDTEQSEVAVSATPSDEATLVDDEGIGSEAAGDTSATDVSDGEVIYVDETEAQLNGDTPSRARPVDKPNEPDTESGFPADLLPQAVQVAEDTRASILQVTGMKERQSSFGTAWLIQPDIAVTNQHVADHDEGYWGQLAIKTITGKVVPVEVINMNSMYDVAFVRLSEPLDIPYLTLESVPAAVGDPVIYTGHAAYIGNWESGAGVVTDIDLFQGKGLTTSLPISPGASGSPIMTLDGTVVGIISGNYWGSTDPGTTPPSDEVTVHTFMPRMDINGGADAAQIAQLAREYGLSLD